MQRERPLLTIAIPTYSRSNYLAQLLSALVPQLVDTPNVELIISDNASPDDTPALVDDFRKNGLQLTYIRNGTNIGPDANFLQCFERANGKYVWIVGDDDIVLPTAIEKILKHLTNKEYELVYVSSFGIQDSYQPRTMPNVSRASEFYTPEELARHVHVFFTFMSGNIVNKDRVCNATHPPFSNLLGTNLIQLGWVYTALNEHRRSLFIHEPLVAARTNNTGGYGLFTVFGSNLTTITDEWLNSDAVKRPIINGTLQKFFPAFLFSTRKSQSAFVQENPDRVLRPLFRANFRYWLFDFPVVAMPVSLARLWFFLGRCINKVDTIVGRPLMR